MQAVKFLLNNKLFGININKIQEVDGLPRVTKVTHSADFFIGFVNVRREILAVIDTAKLLSVGKSEILKKTKIVVVNSDNIKCGFLVDEIKGGINYEDKDVEPVPVNELGENASFFEEILHRKDIDEPIVLLNVDNILKSKEFSVFLWLIYGVMMSRLRQELVLSQSCLFYFYFFSLLNASY